MNCDQAATLLVDNVAGNLDAASAEELRAHLKDCPACRGEEQELRTLWTALGRLPTPAPRPDAPARFARASQDAVIRRRGWRAPRRLVVAGAIAASFLGGIALGRIMPNDSTSPGSEAGVTGAPESGGRFLLLLHETPTTTTPDEAEGRRRVAEYTAWAGALSRRGLLVGAEKLADDGGRWLTSGNVDRPAAIGGYFVVRAGSYEEALGIARECPHFKYGGEIEVRAIERV
ncbi:MAG: zf-HC2 domain-containing protein [Gemmatimonadaceae bacterium]